MIKYNIQWNIILALIMGHTMVFDILWSDAAWILYYAKGSAVLHRVLPSNYVSIFRVIVSLIVSLFLFCSPLFLFRCHIMLYNEY